MIRRLFIAASLLSLLLCLGAGAVCIWSYHDFIQFDAWVASYPPASWPTNGSAGIHEGNWRLVLLVAYIDWGKVDGELHWYRGRYSDAFVRENYPQGVHHETTVAPHDSPPDATRHDPLFSFTHKGDAAFEPHAGTLDVYRFRFPIWFIAALTGLPPLLAGFRLVGRRRANRKGLCAFCGYDLRASNERCPECGSPIPSNVEAKA